MTVFHIIKKLENFYINFILYDTIDLWQYIKKCLRKIYIGIIYYSRFGICV